MMKFDLGDDGGDVVFLATSVLCLIFLPLDGVVSERDVLLLVVGGDFGEGCDAKRDVFRLR